MVSRLCAALMLALELEAPVSIRVSAHSIMAGSSVRVTCRVPRNPENRGLTALLTGSEDPNGLVYRSMFDQMDGESTRPTHEFTFTKVPCDVDLAACVLERQGSPNAVVRESLVVGGCDE
jgi:hypothetical protein